VMLQKMASFVVFFFFKFLNIENTCLRKKFL